MKDEKSILEEQLKDIVGGGDVAENTFALPGTLGDVAAIAKEASATNTCPFCKRPIIPGAESSEMVELFTHISSIHDKG